MFQKAAKNPEVRKLAKAAAGKALKKGSDAARKRAGDSDLAGMAIDFAVSSAVEMSTGIAEQTCWWCFFL